MSNASTQRKGGLGPVDGYLEQRRVGDYFVVNPNYEDIIDLATRVQDRGGYGLRWGVGINKEGERLSFVWNAESWHDQFYQDVLAERGYVFVKDTCGNQEFDENNFIRKLPFTRASAGMILVTLWREFSPIEMDCVGELIQRMNENK